MQCNIWSQTAVMLNLVAILVFGSCVKLISSTRYTLEDDMDKVALNLSDFNLPKSVHVPTYLLQLYASHNLNKKDDTASGLSVRSFEAISTDEEIEGSGRSQVLRCKEIGDTQKVFFECSLQVAFSLAFRVSLPKKERFIQATLRLFAMTPYTRVSDRSSSTEDSQWFHIKVHTGHNRWRLVGQKRIFRLDKRGSWVSIDATDEVSTWISNDSLPQRFTVRAECRFRFCGSLINNNPARIDFWSSPENSPLLLIYSSKEDVEVLQDFNSAFHRIRRSTENEEEFLYGGWDPAGFPSHIYDGRKKKSKRRKMANSCKRKPLTVSFKDIGWEWIVAPLSYEAYQCSGKCFFPLTSHLTPTKHAVVQTLMHSHVPDRASRVCCVPTKLGPISLLYIENNVTTFDYDYDEMVVIECGCR